MIEQNFLKRSVLFGTNIPTLSKHRYSPGAANPPGTFPFFNGVCGLGGNVLDEKTKERFVMVPLYIAENPEISCYAKSVYLALKSHYPNIRCSIERIRSQTGISKPTVLKAIEELELWRLIRTKKTHRKVTEYSLNLKSKSIKTVDYIKQTKVSWVNGVDPAGKRR